MVRNLFVLSLLSFSVVGCMGPKKGPSAVTDGGIDNGIVPAAGLTPVTSVATPAPEAAPAAKKTTSTPAKSKGRLPIKNAGNK
ncbi:MAG: hypothetical protein EBU04_02895 [Verrucomicrobia bacterium]|jgi:hypothetical protein|nr:hypothetical protein [Verrucomicrobiota bacterium]NBS04057.1 hypothetical protein [Verrucomicrobiota bacterium]NBY37119.1 hypothetical protein [Verrucomicrobiota bacterium]